MNQTRSRTVTFAILIAIPLGILAVVGVAILAQVLGISHETLTREPQSVMEVPAYVGAFSNLGALVWALAAVSALITASVVTGPERAMFLAAGLLSTALLFDDLFLLHDVIYPKLGLGETTVQAIYLLAIGLIVVVYRVEMGLVATLGIGLTLAFWALSVVMDTWLNNSPLNYDQLVEDGAKFVGIVVWSAVWVTLAHLSLRTPREPAEAALV